LEKQELGKEGGGGSAYRMVAGGKQWCKKRHNEEAFKSEEKCGKKTVKGSWQSLSDWKVTRKSGSLGGHLERNHKCTYARR